MTWPYPPLPPDTRAVGTGNPALDMDQVIDYIASLTTRTKGVVWDPRDYGAKGDGVTDDTTAIQLAINSMPSQGATLALWGAPVTYLISAPLILAANAAYIGGYLNTTSNLVKADITCSASFSGNAALIDVAAAGTGTPAFAANPVCIFGLSIDLSAVTGTTTDGIRLMTFGAWLYFNLIRVPPQHGIHFTDQNAGGINISNSGVENRACNNGVVRAGNTGILVDNNTQSLTDGYICDNIIHHKAINAGGDASNSTGPCIDVEYAANWQIRGNHLYFPPVDALVAKNTFGSIIGDNVIDQFGLAGSASTTYHGITCPSVNAGPPTIIRNNIIRNRESFGAASTVYQYLQVGTATGVTAHATVSNNSAHQTDTGSATDAAWTYQGNGAGTLNVIAQGNRVVGTTISSATNIAGATVNLVQPGTGLNSGSISLPMGVSSAYGTLTSVLTPLITGTGMIFLSPSIVWGGTFSSDTVNVQFTMTWDDGTTSTQTTATVTSTQTQNPVPGAILGLWKQGRQLVKLQAAARTTQASTSVTCNITVVALAVA